MAELRSTLTQIRPDPDMLYELASGQRFFRRPSDPNEAMLRQAWQAVGPALTAEHVRLLPGSRPHGWWRFIAPERRRQIAGPRHTMLQAHSRVVPHFFYGIPADHAAVDFACTFECQCVYLARHAMLTVDERRLAAAADDWCAACRYRGFGEPHLSLEQIRQWQEGIR